MLMRVLCFADQSQASTDAEPSAPQDKVAEAMSRIVMTSRGVTYGIAFGLLGLLVGLLSQRRAVLSLWWIGLWCFHIGVSTALVSGCVFIDLTQASNDESKTTTAHQHYSDERGSGMARSSEAESMQDSGRQSASLNA